MSPDDGALITLALEDGEWFATDGATGTTGHGETRASALEHLDELLGLERGDLDYSDDFSSDIDTGRDQVERGDTLSAEEVERRFGMDG